MKKITLITFTCLLSLNSFATPSPTNSFYINTINSTSGYFSFKIVSEYPSNNYNVKGIPTNQPYLIAAINSFIAQNLQGDNTAYVEFGYSDGQDFNHWFTNGACKIQLPKNEIATITLTHTKNQTPTCGVSLN